MTGRRRALVLALALLPSLPTVVGALTFSSSVDRFEADGNEFGSADGVFDLVDEFDDASLAPNWEILLGSATEAGSVLTFHDPGVVAPLVGLPQEISVVEASTDAADGAGDFTLTSYWDPTPLPLNRQFFFQFYALSPVIEAWGFTVNNFDATTAAAVGTPVGYSIGVQRVFPLGNQLPTVASYVTLDPATVTGRIVLRMSFDDDTNLMTYAFSLDGGTTFQSPFPAIQAFVLSSEAELLLGAAAVSPSAPPPTCTLPMYRTRAKFQKLLLPAGQQEFRLKGMFGAGLALVPDFDPITQGALLFASSANDRFAVYQIPPGALGVGGCGPADGWRLSGHNYIYANESGALPPFCVPSSANGIEKLQLRDERARRSRIRYTLIAKEMAFQTGVSQAAVEVGIGGARSGGDPVLCSSAALACVNKSTSQSCR
jgi:hypothetical protein